MLRKKTLILVMIILLTTGLIARGGSPIVGGGTGILTIPNANTMGTGVVDLGFYFITPKTISLSLGYGIIEQLDLSAGLELDNDQDDEDPFVHIRAKYRFAGTGKSDSWALGVDLSLALGDKPSEDSRISFYLVNSYWATSLGMQFSWGVGYTIDNDDDFNVMIGVSKQIVKNLYLEMDFSNFSTRYFIAKHAGDERGAGNVALRFHLLDSKLRLTAGLFDAFDGNRQFGAGASFKLAL